MSSKITKRMMSSVDDMVSRASSATKRTGLVTTKRKAAKRALLEAPSKRRGGSGGAASAALKSGSKTVSKKGRKKNGRAVGLLEQARLELRGKSQAARNVSLLSYVRGKEGTKTRSGKLTVSKSRRAVEKLLVLDGSKARTKAFP